MKNATTDPNENNIRPSVSSLPGGDHLMEANNIRSMLRLLLGGSEITIDEFTERLHDWELDIDRQHTLSEIEGLRSESSPDISQNLDSDSDLVRYAMIGLLFDAQDRLRRGANKLSAIDRKIYRATSPLIKTVSSSKLFSPFQRRFDKLVARGQEEVDRWIDTGRREERISKDLAEKAFSNTVDSTIHALADNPELQQLIQTQTTGLASEVVEEIRERTVSADIYFEAIARSLLRRQPRHNLPSPPPVVMEYAGSLRPSLNRSNEKQGKSNK